VFLRAAGHPLRWRLLSGGCYHLRQLRTANTITVRHSATTGRDTHYRLALAGKPRVTDLAKDFQLEK
jgi:hypothetical protein